MSPARKAIHYASRFGVLLQPSSKDAAKAPLLTLNKTAFPTNRHGIPQDFTGP